jgi:GTP-binding protein YchF
LGNKFLSHIRETDAIAEVVRIFEDDKVIHVDSSIDPLRDIGVINLELVLADLETVTKRRANLEKDVKARKKEAIVEAAICDKLKKVLEEGKLAQTAEILEEEKPIVKQLNLLTTKPILYVLNKKSGGKNLDDLKDDRWNKLIEFLNANKYGYVIVDAAIENDLKEMNEDEKAEMKKDLGAVAGGVDDLIRKGYEILNLMTYFTTGEDESRAWTIHKGWTAPLAGTAIHNDFKDKFVKAEVIEWNKLLEAGSYGAAREKGWVRTEGKEYIVKDGDVIEFKI